MNRASKFFATAFSTPTVSRDGTPRTNERTTFEQNAPIETHQELRTSQDEPGAPRENTADYRSPTGTRTPASKVTNAIRRGGYELRAIKNLIATEVELLQTKDATRALERTREELARKARELSAAKTSPCDVPLRAELMERLKGDIARLTNPNGFMRVDNDRTKAFTACFAPQVAELGLEKLIVEAIDLSVTNWPIAPPAKLDEEQLTHAQCRALGNMVQRFAELVDGAIGVLSHKLRDLGGDILSMMNARFPDRVDRNASTVAGALVLRPLLLPFQSVSAAAAEGAPDQVAVVRFCNDVLTKAVNGVALQDSALAKMPDELRAAVMDAHNRICTALSRLYQA